MKNVDRTPIEEEESEFPGCLIVGILVAVLGSFYIIMSILARIKDIVIHNKPVEFIKASIKKQRPQKRAHREENIEK